jgi:hypothetical protein
VSTHTIPVSRHVKRGSDGARIVHATPLRAHSSDSLCPCCNGVRVLINRLDHSRFYDCPLCKGSGKYNNKV